MNKRDIFDALREGDPAAGIDLDEAARLKQRIRARVLTAARPQPTRPRIKRVAVAALVAVLASAAVAAAVYLTRQPTNPVGVGCAEGLDLDAAQYVVTPTEGLDPGECAPLWADGTITNPAIVAAGQVPPLLGCVNDTGTLIIFPTDDPGFCEQVGMANYVPSGNNTIVQVEGRLVELFLARGCIEMDEAKPLVEQTLTDAGLDDWTAIISQPSTPERPCAGLAFEGDTRQIILVPIPRTGP